MHILLCGASGHVGTGLAERLGDRHEITGLVRSPVEGSRPYHPLVVPEWVDEPDSVLTAVSRRGPVDAVLAAIGGWFVDGPMLARGIGHLDAVYASHLRGHVAACAISERLGVGAHLALNGVASIEACVGSWAISVFGAAQEMLLRVAAAETESVAYRELRILAPVSGDDRNDLSGGVATLGMDAVAEAAEAILSDPGAHGPVTEISAGD